MTDIQICNYALTLIGHTEAITSLTDETAASRICGRVYDITRQNLLTEFPWNFAVKPAALTEVTDETSLEGYAYVYEYPDDCLRVLRIFYGSEPDGTINKYKVIYTEDSGVNVRRIVCDLDDAYAEYVLDLQDEAAFPSVFCEVLAYRIAMQVSMGLSSEARIMQAMQQGYVNALERAKYLMAREQQQSLNKGNRYVNARR